MKKYKITKEKKKVNGITLFRIKALKSFGKVTKGDLGGWIESKHNLSHKGNCWVADEACVYDKAKVSGNARIYGNAMVYALARVSGEAWIFGHAQVSGYAQVSGNARIYEDAQVYMYARVYGHAQVSGYAKVFWYAQVYAHALVSKYARVFGNSLLTGKCNTKAHQLIPPINITKYSGLIIT